jgi:hypothetical protein
VVPLEQLRNSQESASSRVQTCLRHTSHISIVALERSLEIFVLFKLAEPLRKLESIESMELGGSKNLSNKRLLQSLVATSCEPEE